MSNLAEHRPNTHWIAARWRPRGERAALGTVAVIAWIDEAEGTPYLLPDMYRYNGLDWRDEITGHLLRPGACYWMPEKELLACLN